MRMGSAPTIPKRPLTSVCAGQPMFGAPRRNRTGDPFLTMDRRRGHLALDVWFDAPLATVSARAAPGSRAPAVPLES